MPFLLTNQFIGDMNMTQSKPSKFNVQYILGVLIMIVMLSLACLATSAYFGAQETIDNERQCINEQVVAGASRADAEVICKAINQ